MDHPGLPEHPDHVYPYIDPERDTDEYSDRYGDNYGDGYAHSHHHRLTHGDIVTHIGTGPLNHTHDNLGTDYGYARIDGYAFRYAAYYGYEHPSRAAAVSLAVYLTHRAHGYPHQPATAIAIRTFHDASFYHEPDADERTGSNGHLGVPATAAIFGKPNGEKRIPNQARRKRTLRRSVGQLRRAGVPGGGTVSDPESNRVSDFSAGDFFGYAEPDERAAAPTAHEHPVIRAGAMGTNAVAGDIYGHPDHGGPSCHAHAGDGLGFAYGHPVGAER